MYRLLTGNHLNFIQSTIQNKEEQNLEKNRQFVQLGRGLGEFSTVDNKKIFVVSNGFNQEELSQFEYVIWGQVSGFPSLVAWENSVLKNIGNVRGFNLEKIVKRLREINLIHPWAFSGIEDSSMVAIHATRQGYAHGAVKGKWLISDSQTKKSLNLTKEAYDVWNAAAGRAMLLEVIDRLMEQRQTSVDEAFGLVVNNGFKLTQLGLWNLEYIDISEKGGEK